MAELDGAGTCLLVLRGDSTMLQRDRPAIALSNAKMEVRTGTVGDLVGGDELRRAARATPDLIRTPT
ncbi:MAG: hypothetical protein ACJ762_07230 [Solirubrobacteraceae bacterium]